MAKPERTVPWLAIGLGVGGLAIGIAIVVLAAVIYHLNNADKEPLEYTDGASLDSAAAVAAEEAKTQRQEAKSKKRRNKESRKERRERRARKAKKKGKRKGQKRKARAAKYVSGPFVVKFKSPDARTRLECGDGQKVAFLGTTRVTFQSITTCRVVIGDAQSTVVVREPSQFICSASGGRAVCRRR